jgi:hypothetical protein
MIAYYCPDRIRDYGDFYFSVVLVWSTWITPLNTHYFLLQMYFQFMLFYNVKAIL